MYVQLPDAEDDAAEAAQDMDEAALEPLHSAYDVEVHDLRGFLRISAREGRPAVHDALVARAEEVIAQVGKNDGQDATARSSLSRAVCLPFLGHDAAMTCLTQIWREHAYSSAS